jgi:hypothetical protein
VSSAGHERGEQMPWQPIGKWYEELAAIYEYLIHLPDVVARLRGDRKNEDAWAALGAITSQMAAISECRYRWLLVHDLNPRI